MGNNRITSHRNKFVVCQSWFFYIWLGVQTQNASKRSLPRIIWRTMSGHIQVKHVFVILLSGLSFIQCAQLIVTSVRWDTWKLHLNISFKPFNGYLQYSVFIAIQGRSLILVMTRNVVNHLEHCTASRHIPRIDTSTNPTTSNMWVENLSRITPYADVWL